MMSGIHLHSHKHPVSALNALSRIDPTKTLTLRTRFAADITRRFRELKRDIRTTIIENDAFGLKKEKLRVPGMMESAPPLAFDFLTSKQKVEAFMKWLREQQAKGLLEIIEKPGFLRPSIQEAWTDIYIRSAYEKGVLRADAELAKIGVEVTKTTNIPGARIVGVFDQPAHADRAGALFTRVFSDLEGITEAMDSQISRILAEGLIFGGSPDQLAKEIVKKVDGIGLNRARTLARTEIIRAHHLGSIQEFRNAAINNVIVQAEYVTAEDPCPICEPYEGRVMSLDEAESLIPQHPNSYSDDTEIYTYEGWKPVSEMKIGDKCLSLNTETGELDYKKVIRTYKHYEKEMYHFWARDFDLIVTADHDMLCIKKNPGLFEFIKARDITDDCLFLELDQHSMFYHANNLSNPCYWTKVDREIIPYHNTAYCVELPEWHTLLVSRIGKITWCGNCRCTIKPYVEGIS